MDIRRTRRTTALAALALVLATASVTNAAEEPVKQVIAGPMLTMAEKEIGAFVGLNTATLTSDAAARGLIEKTIGSLYPSFRADDPSFYCIIHVLRWTDAKGSQSQQVGKQNWYVYHHGWDNARMGGKRILGSRNVWLLMVHLNPRGEYETRYDVVITKKIPTNIANLTALAKLFPGGGFGAAAGVPEFNWKAEKLDVRSTPVDIEITPSATSKVRFTNLNGDEINSDPPVTNNEPIDKAQTFNNEGKYYWDVGIGVPIRSIKELKKDDAGNLALAEKRDKSSVLALLHVYPVPVDLSATVPPAIPHFVLGIDITETPLRRLMLGAGYGLPFLDIYGGRMRISQEDPNGGKDLVDWQWTVGVTVPVRRIVQVLK